MDIALEILIEELIDIIKAKAGDKFESVIAQLREIGAPAYELLCLSLKNSNEFEGQYLLDAIIAIGNPIVPYLLKILPDVSGMTMSYIIYAFGELKDESTIDVIKKAFNDGDAQVKYAALQTIDKFYKPEFDIILYKALNDTSTEIRSQAAGILGNLKCNLALDALTVMTGDPDPGIRAVAARALGKLNEKQGFDAIIKLLDDPVIIVSSAACLALGETGNPEFIENIKKMLVHKSEIVRMAAIKALGRMHSPQAIDELKICINDDNEQIRELTKKVIYFLDNLKRQ